MNADAVQQILNDLPQTFKRLGAPYTQLVDSMTNGLALYTNGADGVMAQLNFDNATAGWLQLWGLLFGVPKQSDEADANYRQRIVFEVTSGNGTVLGMQFWALIVWKIIMTVTESLPTVGYKLTFPATLTAAQINTIIASLARVRPAGVPITGIQIEGGSAYLKTVNFLNAPRVAGAFLSSVGSSLAAQIVIPATTNNSQPLIPDLYLTDPTLNP